MRRFRPRGDSGAAALEFALVVPVLLVIVFGIIDYGLYFSDELGARDGVRVAARQGVVQDFGACQKLQCLADVARDNMDTFGSTEAFKVALVTTGSNPDGWVRGNELQVCARVDVNGLTSFTPMPGGGVIEARVSMRIEQDDGGKKPTDAPEYVEGNPADWDWCP